MFVNNQDSGGDTNQRTWAVRAATVEHTRFQSKTDQVRQNGTLPHTWSHHCTHLVPSLHMTYLYATNKNVQIRTTTWPNACSIDVLQTWNTNWIQMAKDVHWYSKFEPQVVTHHCVHAKHGFGETWKSSMLQWTEAVRCSCLPTATTTLKSCIHLSHAFDETMFE